MLFRVKEDGELAKLQLSSHPQCALFEQRIDGDSVFVRYHTPAEPLVPFRPAQQTELEVPLEPDAEQLETIQITLHNSPASVAYRMGQPYDDWFSDCFGFDTILVYIGDGRRPILGSAILPPPYHQPAQEEKRGWLSSIASYVTGPAGLQDQPVITFSDMAPFLVASESSLANVTARFSQENPVEMHRFRPNIVVDGEEEWAEDFWSELDITSTNENDDGDGCRLLLTGNCARCTSLNVDYMTGRVTVGELGSVLKRLMKDRRVDKGTKWSPIFGRYAFLDGQEEAEIAVGDRAEVTARRTERSVWDWPM